LLPADKQRGTDGTGNSLDLLRATARHPAYENARRHIGGKDSLCRNQRAARDDSYNVNARKNDRASPTPQGSLAVDADYLSIARAGTNFLGDWGPANGDS
jgi:hypothetical protein